eukprot:5208350-Pleurochrysis_carterae.AAC.1
MCTHTRRRSFERCMCTFAHVQIPCVSTFRGLLRSMRMVSLQNAAIDDRVGWQVGSVSQSGRKAGSHAGEQAGRQTSGLAGGGKAGGQERKWAWRLEAGMALMMVHACRNLRFRKRRRIGQDTQARV